MSKTGKSQPNGYVGLIVVVVTIFFLLALRSFLSRSSDSSSSASFTTTIAKNNLLASGKYQSRFESTVSEVTWCVPTNCSVLEAAFAQRVKLQTSVEDFVTTRNEIMSLTFCEGEQRSIPSTTDRLQFTDAVYTALLTRRKMCDFEHKAIKDAVGREKVGGLSFYLGAGFPIYHSYNLLAAAIITKPLMKFDKGYWLEFGVATGKSMNITTEAFRYRGNLPYVKLHGFDSFEGLPTAWKSGTGHYGKGEFTLHGKVPPVKKEATLHKGLFDQTLPPFLASHPLSKRSEPIDDNVLIGINIDNDLLEGTNFILKQLLPYMRVGTVLHFHEIFSPIPSNNPMDELYAMHRFLVENKVVLEMLPIRSQEHQAGIFVITSIRS